MKGDGRYVRVYYTVIEDERFAGIFDDDRCLATWLRLLLVADAMWPAPGDLPRSAHPKAVALLATCGLVDLVPPHRFRIHGLDTERNARSNAASNAAAKRWHPSGNAESSADGNAKSMPSRARAEQSKAKTNLSTPQLLGVVGDNRG